MAPAACRLRKPPRPKLGIDLPCIWGYGWSVPYPQENGTRYACPQEKAEDVGWSEQHRRHGYADPPGKQCAHALCNVRIGCTDVQSESRSKKRERASEREGERGREREEKRKRCGKMSRTRRRSVDLRRKSCGASRTPSTKTTTSQLGEDLPSIWGYGRTEPYPRKTDRGMLVPRKKQRTLGGQGSTVDMDTQTHEESIAHVRFATRGSEAQKCSEREREERGRLARNRASRSAQPASTQTNWKSDWDPHQRLRSTADVSHRA